MDDNNEIEELEIGLEVDNSELKESFNEAKSIIRNSINEITNILRNANIGNSLSDNIAKNLQKSIDDALKSVGKSTKNLDIKANLDIERTTQSKGSKGNNSSSSSGNGLSTAASAIDMATSANMAKSSGSMKNASGSMAKSSSNMKNASGSMTKSSGSMTKTSSSMAKSSSNIVEGAKKIDGTGDKFKSTGEQLVTTSEKIGDVTSTLGDTASNLEKANSVFEGSSTKLNDVFNNASNQLGETASTIYSTSYLMQHSGMAMGETFGKIGVKFNEATEGLTGAADSFESSGNDIYESGDLFSSSSVTFDEAVTRLIKDSKEKLYEANLTQIKTVLDSIAEGMQGVIDGLKPLTERDYERNKNQFNEQKEAFNQTKSNLESDSNKGSVSEAAKRAMESAQNALETTETTLAEAGKPIEDAREAYDQYIESLKQNAVYIKKGEEAFLNTLTPNKRTNQPSQRFAGGKNNKGNLQKNLKEYIGDIYDPDDVSKRPEKPAVILDKQDGENKGFWVTKNAMQKDLIEKHYNESKNNPDAYNERGVTQERLLESNQRSARLKVSDTEQEQSLTKEEQTLERIKNRKGSFRASDTEDPGKDTPDFSGSNDSIEEATDVAEELKETIEEVTDATEELREAVEDTTSVIGDLKEAVEETTSVIGDLKEKIEEVNNTVVIKPEVDTEQIEQATESVEELKETISEVNKPENVISFVDAKNEKDYENLTKKMEQDFKQAVPDDNLAGRKASELRDKKSRLAVGSASNERGIEEQAVMKELPNLGNSLEGAIAFLKVLDEINDAYGRTLSTINSGEIEGALKDQFKYWVDGLEENGYNLSNTLETLSKDLVFNFRQSYEEIAENSKSVLEDLELPALDASAMQNAYDTLKKAATSALSEIQDKVEDVNNSDIKIQVSDNELNNAKQDVKELDDAIDKLDNNKTDKVQKEIKEIGNEAEKSSGKIRDLIKGLLPAIGGYLGFETLRTSITNAMSVLDSSSMAAGAFGDNMDEMNSWLKDVNSRLGLSYEGTQKFTASIGQMGRTMGLTSSEAMDLSQKMALISEFASRSRGMELDSVYDDMKDAIMGSYDALEKYGIKMDETEFGAWAVSRGLAASADSMTSLERTTAVTTLLTERLGYTEQYLAESMKSPSVQASLLRDNLHMLGTALGNCFMPILTVVLPLLNTFVNALTSVLNSVANFIASIFALFGVKVSAATATATQGVQGIGAALGGLGDVGGGGGGTGAAADGLDDVGESASGAAEEVKKLKGLMG